MKERQETGRHKWEFQNPGVNVAEYIVYLKEIVSREHSTARDEYTPF